jgi:peptidyl-prolyl cis-trans isomerase A (cyclophilin A)
MDPATVKLVKGKSLYENTVFHRVIPNFMIQGGDPEGTGMGGPGYKFKDEIDPELTFDRPGRLAMANSGPHSNGSQFFITHEPAPWLNGKHTIFGQVIQGQAIVVQIGNVPRDEFDRPIKEVRLERVEVFRVEKSGLPRTVAAPTANPAGAPSLP